MIIIYCGHSQKRRRGSPIKHIFLSLNHAIHVRKISTTNLKSKTYKKPQCFCEASGLRRLTVDLFCTCLYISYFLVISLQTKISPNNISVYFYFIFFLLPTFRNLLRGILGGNSKILSGFQETQNLLLNLLLKLEIAALN